MNIRQIARYLALKGEVAEHSHAQRRGHRLIQTAIAGVSSKGMALVVSFVSVSLTVPYLGLERYGVWVAISTLLAWLQISDLGLGNGLMNFLAEAYGKENTDIAQRYVATAFWVLVAFALALSALLLPLGWLIPWADLFRLQSALARQEVVPALLMTCLLTLLTLPFTSVERVYAAYQEGMTANYWQALAHIASLLGIIIVTLLQGGLVALVIGFSGGLLLIKVLSAIWLFGIQKPWLRPAPAAIDLQVARPLIALSWQFFVVQVAYLLIFQTDNIVIASVLGADQVAPYSVAWRLFSYATIFQILVYPALWPAFTEAFARNDRNWILRAFWLFLAANATTTAIMTLPLLFFGQYIIALWAGPAVVPPQSLLIWMAMWNMIYVVLSSFACLLNGSGNVAGQTIYGMITALVNIILSIILAHWLGIIGVIMATVIAYLSCSVIPEAIETWLVLRRLPSETSRVKS